MYYKVHIFRAPVFGCINIDLSKLIRIVSHCDICFRDRSNLNSVSIVYKKSLLFLLFPTRGALRSGLRRGLRGGLRCGPRSGLLSGPRSGPRSGLRSYPGVNSGVDSGFISDRYGLNNVTIRSRFVPIWDQSD